MLALAAASCSSGDEAKPDVVLRVFAGTSTIDAFQDVADAFEEAHDGVEVELTFDTPDALVDRIDDGEPAAVLATADSEAIDRVIDLGLARSPQAFARNRLAIAVPAGNPGGVHSIEDLERSDLDVALCHPTLPCGALGRDLLDRAGVEVRSTEIDPSGRGVLARVASGDADAGIAWTTDFESFVHDLDVVEIADVGGLDAVYQVTALSTAVPRELADLFVAFVQSEPAQDVLRSHGFVAT